MFESQATSTLKRIAFLNEEARPLEKEGLAYESHLPLSRETAVSGQALRAGDTSLQKAEKRQLVIFLPSEQTLDSFSVLQPSTFKCLLQRNLIFLLREGQKRKAT